MGKSRINCRGLTKEQQLLKENKELKRENSRLRKEFARIDLDRYENVKEAVEEHERNLGLPTTQDLLESLKNEWACKINGCNGYLEVILFNKRIDTYYYRACNQCNNRTVSQKYDPRTVKGIIKKADLSNARE